MNRILIVDDKEDNLYYLRTLLTGSGFVVESASHGAEALVKARQQPPDLIVSDLLMPVMDGYTLLRHWKADERLKKIPFIVYTATYTEEEDERLALSLGADAFILKPAEPEDFLTRIREIQAKVAAAEPSGPQQPVGDEKELFKIYSETLIRKLEEKTLQLEAANHALQQDIAGRQQAEAQLKLLETCVARLNDIVLITEAEPISEPGPRILFVNDAFVRRTGYAREEALGRSPRFLQGPKTSRTELDRIGAALREWKPVRAELINYTKSGAEFWLEIDIVPVADAMGRCTHWVSVERDITERKNLEQQILRAQRMDSIGTLAGGIAHDLNNVLGPIMMSLAVLELRFPDPDSQELISILSASAQRGADMVRQILAFARGVEGQRMEVQLKHLIQDIEKIANDTFLKHIRVRTVIPYDLWTVLGDFTQLHQVLLNLCVNARDAMPDGGALVISAENIFLDEHYAGLNPEAKAGPYVALRVEDSGTGIAPEVLEKIFDPFFTTKELGNGTGLGLSTTLGIVKSHGGFVRVESEPGQGTKFQVFLPARTETSAEVVAAQAAALPRGNGELILVVDDEVAVRQITQQTLEAFGYRVLLAKEGADAVASYAQRSAEIAAVVMDMTMPVMDGPATIRVLRKLNPAVRIVGASGLSTNEDLAAINRLGVKHFLPKPYTAETLLKVLKQVLEES